MKHYIKDVLFTKSLTGFYFDDQPAIKANAKLDGFYYLGTPVTPGFRQIRQPGEAVSVILILNDGTVAVGDCAAVQYSGCGGRDSLFLAEEYIPFLEKEIKPLLIGEAVDRFRILAEKYDKLSFSGQKMHTAIRYGLTQAFLKATAAVRRLTMAEVIREEYNIDEDEYRRIPIFSQSGDERYLNLDKMIMKEVDVLPHGLINTVDGKLGRSGELLLDYLVFIKERVLNRRCHADYEPIIHIDVYGTIGMIFEMNVLKIVNYLEKLAAAAYPLRLRIEGPIDAGGREDTMIMLRAICREIDARGLRVEIVADEWCNTLDDIIYFADNGAGHMLQIKTPDLGGVNNTIEAILYCNKKQVGSYCGGTCNETNISAEVSINIAVACQATQFLAKPGMGCDEGLMIVNNEMNRVLALANTRRKQ
ncbi:MAG: methylaspartate ammonia-lyase [Bacilli bacterium]|nr:methylaspartate ammonia-lyase [Bacilli bacterium]MDD4077488.1 methylaspartate ammonia-lyase [Bacilli bacterium]MDD4388263.1 methylaspartate ammonia-lyase [Bacilli bacterium]